MSITRPLAEDESDYDRLSDLHNELTMQHRIALERIAEHEAEIRELQEKRSQSLPALFDVMVLVMGALDAVSMRLRVNEEEIRSAVTNRYTSLGLLPPDARPQPEPTQPELPMKAGSY